MGSGERASIGDVAPAAVAPRRYRAFISYSHRDAAVGRWLHRALETYRLPRRLGNAAPLTPIFRDREELTAGDLTAQVRAALAASDALVVVCTPAAAASPWVAREIALFREIAPGAPVFAALFDGEPDAAFPAALRDGGTEPLAADFRKAGDGRRLALLKLVAGLSGVGVDALVQRDAQRRIRRVTAVTVGALIAALVMAVLTIAALRARTLAETQRTAAEGLVEFMLTDLRTRLKGVGRLDVLSAVNARAMGYYAGQDLRALPPASLERRARVLHAMGEDDGDRGDLRRAAIEFDEAGRTTASLLAAAPDDPERIFAHAQSIYWRGMIAERLGRFDAALIAYRDYRAAARRLIAQDSASVRNRLEMAYAETAIGVVELNGRKRPAAAREAFRAALRWFEAVAAEQHDAPEALMSVANARAWLADAAYAEQDWAQARLHRQAEIALKRRCLGVDPKNAAWRFAMVPAERSLARVELLLGDAKAAEATLAGARAAMRKLLAADPANVNWLDQAARIEIDFARLYAGTGRPAPARVALFDARRFLSDGDARGAAGIADRRQLRTSIQKQLALLAK